MLLLPAMILLYTHSISRRLEYIIGFFSKELFDEEIVITTDVELFQTASAVKLNYSFSLFSEDVFNIPPASLLFENNIIHQEIHCFETNNLKAFFQVNGDYPFDIFAASFFLLTRYEEYLPSEKDAYGRFSHVSSLAYSQDFLHIPLIDSWIEDFKRALSGKFRSLNFKRRQFKCIISYDIDIAYAYSNKGWKGNLAGLSKSILTGNWQQVKNRLSVLNGKEKDPYDCYEWLDALHLYCRTKPYYFFLVARKQNHFDRNIPTHTPAFIELIEYYAAHYQVGIHPSWRSNDQPQLLKEEIEWLEVVADKKIENSRQHYIRVSFPETYRRLLESGIRKDFSMGYATVNGFRASVSVPFLWFDLIADRKTELMIYPFCFMDANSYYEQKLTPQEAYQELIEYYERVKKVNGTLITIWHNNILSTLPEMQGWREMFETFMKDTVYWDAYYDEA